jgi:hypothetical protein
VGSDLPCLSGVSAWERQLLVPFVERLIEDALADSATREQNLLTEKHEKDNDKEP